MLLNLTRRKSPIISNPRGAHYISFGFERHNSKFLFIQTKLFQLLFLKVWVNILYNASTVHSDFFFIFVKTAKKSLKRFRELKIVTSWILISKAILDFISWFSKISAKFTMSSWLRHPMLINKQIKLVLSTGHSQQVYLKITSPKCSVRVVALDCRYK